MNNDDDDFFADMNIIPAGPKVQTQEQQNQTRAQFEDQPPTDMGSGIPGSEDFPIDEEEDSESVPLETFVIPPAENLRLLSGGDIVDFILKYTTPEVLLACLELPTGTVPIDTVPTDDIPFGTGARGSRFGSMYGLQTPNYSNLRNSQDILTMPPEFPNLLNVERNYGTSCHFGSKRSYPKKKRGGKSKKLPKRRRSIKVHKYPRHL